MSQSERKRSTVRHTRAIQRDRTKRPYGVPPAEAIAAHLTEIIQPATMEVVSQFHAKGLRERTLNLPVMMAVLLSAVWRQVNGIMDLSRLIQTEVLLWAQPIKVSQQALSQRLSSLPAELFLEVLEKVLPLMHIRWVERSRPLPPEIEWAQAHYTQVCICDGSTLDSLIRKLKVLRDLPKHPLAGRMTALLDMGSRLPIHIWYTPDSSAHDQTFWAHIVSKVKAGALLVFDLGYTNFAHFAQLSARQITFLTRAKSNLSYQLIHRLHTSAALHDSIVWIGSDKDGTRQQIRLIEVLYRGLWYRYLTNELDDTRLPTDIAVALYWQRWRIEDAYAIVKRLLGLAYFWCADDNAIRLQLWTTWPPKACMPPWSISLMPSPNTSIAPSPPSPWRWSTAACITSPKLIIAATSMPLTRLSICVIMPNSSALSNASPSCPSSTSLLPRL